MGCGCNKNKTTKDPKGAKDAMERARKLIEKKAATSPMPLVALKKKPQIKDKK